LPPKKKDFIDLVIDAYQTVFTDDLLTNRKKYRGAAGDLLKIWKKEYPNQTTTEALETISGHFKHARA
jgi:hypothetical protein